VLSIDHFMTGIMTGYRYYLVLSVSKAKVHREIQQKLRAASAKRAVRVSMPPLLRLA